jgi:hypothetical protein
LITYVTQTLCFLTQNDVITSGNVLFEIADPFLFCHPVRDRLASNRVDNFEAKGFLRNDKIKGKVIKLGVVVFWRYAAVKLNHLHSPLLVLRNIS